MKVDEFIAKQKQHSDNILEKFILSVQQDI